MLFTLTCEYVIPSAVSFLWSFRYPHGWWFNPRSCSMMPWTSSSIYWRYPVWLLRTSGGIRTRNPFRAAVLETVWVAYLMPTYNAPPSLLSPLGGGWTPLTWGMVQSYSRAWWFHQRDSMRQSLHPESNWRPSHYEWDALPTELWRHVITMVSWLVICENIRTLHVM